MEDSNITRTHEKKISLHGLNRAHVGDYVIAFIIFLLSLTCILPFVHILAKSLSSDTAVLSKAVAFIPKGINVKAYSSIIRDGKMTYSLFYTIGMTALFTVIGMVITICAAYPLSIKGLKGKGFFSFILMFTMYFSAGLIPEYLLINDLGLLNTIWALALPLCFSAYNMLIMRSFMSSTIPDSLYEAAYLDGANDLKILTDIVLPLSTPILATLTLFYAVGRWNAYADAKYYITSLKLQPLQYLLSNMVLDAASSDAISLSEGSATESTPEVLQAAAIMFTTIPIIIVYPFVQKYFVQGTMIGAVKG